MLTIIYPAYLMMALLYETVPAFKNNWIECLGDIDVTEWPSKTTMFRIMGYGRLFGGLTVGRLYHHLAILAENHPQP
jgi:uncharacterized protein (DUF608 family)